MPRLFFKREEIKSLNLVRKVGEADVSGCLLRETRVRPCTFTHIVNPVLAVQIFVLFLLYN